MSQASRPTTVFLVLAAATGVFSMLQSLLNPALPTIQVDLGASRSDASWIIIAWLLSASVAMPIIGKIGDSFGKKRMLLVALGAAALGSLIAAVSPNIIGVIAGRVVQGLGGAVFPLSFGLVRDALPQRRVASAIGILSSVIAVAGGLGMVLAGPVIEMLDWRWLFWLPMILFIVVGIAAWALIPASTATAGGRINWLAATLLSGWLVALLLPLSEGTSWGWSSPLVIALLVAAAVLLVAWIVVETRSSNPLIDMKMMRLPAVWTTNLVSMLFGASMFAVYAFLPQFLQIPTSAGYGFGASVTMAGWLMFPMLAGMAVSGSFSGPLSSRLGFKSQIAVGSAAIALASFALAFAHATMIEVIVETTIVGIGLGFAYAAMVSLIVNSVPANQTGAATGMNSNLRTIGGGIGTAVMAAIITSAHGPDGVPLEIGFTTGFAFFGAVAAGALLIALLIPSARRNPEPTGTPAVEGGR